MVSGNFKTVLAQISDDMAEQEKAQRIRERIQTGAGHIYYGQNFAVGGGKLARKAARKAEKRAQREIDNACSEIGLS